MAYTACHHLDQRLAYSWRRDRNFTHVKAVTMMICNSCQHATRKLRCGGS